MIEATQDGVKLFVKVVPNASADQIVGRFGERLKVRVSSPPESGKANKTVCELISNALGVRVHAVSVLSGRTNQQKAIDIHGISVQTVRNIFDF